ncbi:MAG: hypothetical protein CMG55_09920 [Candidatus Marinimicrobia bacterium]|nr:hypothetical protein [Candidatus Neomarinimicrobiota bacterium]
MIEKLIYDLKNFAKQDFPIPEMSNHLQNLNINDNSLKKYTFIEKKFYTRNLIHREKDFEILLICWPAKTNAPIHGHEGEKCWARVEQGNLQIGNYKEISKVPLKLKLINKLSCDPGFLDGPADIHSVENISNSLSTSLHIYAKPYDACDIYNTEKKSIERKKLSYYSIDGKTC